MEGLGFQFVCAGCLETRGVLEAEELPSVCPECGTADPWAGPIARSRFVPRYRPELIDSPFYMAAHRDAPGVRRSV
jgi:hypothetical protein